ncbi:Kae1-associated kinase [Barnesiella viscericola DSM 18177]|uniref:Kae1-associated kinase n=1 Tax=Barnesiella viscericola DSM 18177 TaxID=880074 RepID=W0EPU2_9BACT|nr:putative LPS assembly protein LptD [Barnesiella viscericola]AHF12825.1 Kae1-associated kinase [Barnesiella viscericola DSM 18177]
MSKESKKYAILLSLLFSSLFVSLIAQDRHPSYSAATSADSTPANDSSATALPLAVPALPDSTGVDSLAADSLSNDSLATDSVPKKKKNGLTSVVDYQANDSIVFTNGNEVYMYGKGVVQFDGMELNADQIEMNMDSSQVYAVGRPDTVGDIVGRPVFKDKSGEYESETMHYNFKTKKGYITNIVTQQGEGYLTGGQTKKMDNDEFYMKDGKYTTCDNHEHPHFYLQLTQAKVRPKKNIVTGPAYMVLADVPLPLAIPFGFFPFTEKYSSGIIMPTFGDELERGYYLRDGGYYFAINDYVDLALTGEIYTKGSWGVNARSAYIKRYKYSGNVDLSFITTITGDKGLPDYSKMKNFKVAWTHTQDTKNNPNMSLSASVNYTTSGYTRNDLNSYYNANAFTENTKSSTVNMTYRVPNSPWSFSATANVTQRTQDSTLNVSFPNLTISMGQVYPFKRKTVVGNERWYERIQLSYSGRFQNSILTKQDQILKSNLIKDWRNGMYHNIPISATFNLFKYLNLTASFNFTDRMYSNKVMQDWDTQQARVVRDTVYGFYNVYNYYGSLSADTKLYGFYTPWKIFGDKVQAIRHIFTPTISFSAAPDFSAPRYGFWDSYSYVNEYGETVTTKYSPFSNGVYGTVSQGRQGTVSFAVSNNLEMKVKSDRDSTGVRKISLIENLSANMSYNMAADSMKWSNLNTSILIKLTKNFNLQMSAVWDTYTYQLDRYGNPVRVNKPRWTVGKGIGRLSSTGTSFSYTFNNDTFKKKDKDSDSKNTQQQRQQPNALPTDPNSGDEEEEAPGDSDVQFGPDGYSIWEIPWSLSINYSVNYGYGTFNKKKMEYNGRFTQNLSLSGNINLTKNWSFNFSASYDFNAKKIAYMNCNVTRDMHCWSMSASFVPVGPYKSYNFHISVKSSLLQDLKYDKHGNSYNSLDWY